jgi:hypothetical protein|tara:strand:+ start:51 stop:518 length:468 start_codon:yes stop_codon:yes gene_type:complete
MTAHTLDGFTRGMAMEERATRIVTSIDELRIFSRDWDHERDLLIDMLGDFSLSGVTEEQVAGMYLERQKRFVAKKSVVSHNPKATREGVKCRWPLGCSHKGILHADHILPRSAFFEGVRDLYDITKNSITLCPTHNVILKGNHISTGLWIRRMTE